MAVVVLMSILLALGSNGIPVNAREQFVGKESTLTTFQSDMPENNNDFACNLFRNIYEQEHGSIVVSPISVSYLLGMLHEGADGKTRQQINDVLGLGGSVEEINKYFKKMMDEAANVDSKVTVKIANCLDFISGYKLIPQYKADMQYYYNAQVDAVSFNEDVILNKINSWCKKNTDGMIPELLSKGELNPNRVMYLLNAVYFKASWTEKFDPEKTRDRHFTKLDGTTVKHPMMHLLTKAYYGENNQCKLLRLPYGNKGYSMVVLLPNEGKTINDIIKSLSAQSLEEQLHQMTSTKVDIQMPRFATESETHLEKVLSSMGMPLAFNREAAEFPNMIQVSNDLYVSMMKQKAKIEVNEEGTKAAAVTIAEVSERSAMPNRRLYEEFHATRPFVYFIVENTTGSILFMGTYCGDEGVALAQGEVVPDKSNATRTRPIVCRPIPNVTNDKPSEEIFKSVEQMPCFPGGEAGLMKYIDSHLNYPPEAAQNKIQGRVIVQFVVEKDGSIGEVKVVRSVNKDLDKEAIRLVKSLPDFTPGRQNGQAVPVWYTLPVTFKLPK